MASPPPAEPSRTETYDVAVIGGALSGAAAALLLRRRNPELRVLVIEQEERFGRKVGEATVEVSAFFLHDILGLSEHLAEAHLPKHGLRYWFSASGDAAEEGEQPARALVEMSEVGPGETPLLPSFQLDRSTLDEHVLATAVAEGAELLRPARVRSATLPGEDGPEPLDEIGSTLEIDTDDGPRTVRARWVIDASGRHAFLARRLKLRRRTEDHPTAALWGRWSGVKNMDDADLLEAGLPRLEAKRRNATNHFCGHGWWSWMIPLRGGDTSVGVVYDKRLLQLDGDGPEDRYRRFVAAQPGLAELLTDATLDENDFHSYSHLPYSTERYAGRGWALVGDAASFMDPFYSPGLDHAAMSVTATVRMVEDELAGRLEGSALGERLDEHNLTFTASYRRWLEALYVDRYEVLGDAQLTAAGLLIDTATYYLFVLTPIKDDPDELRWPAFGKPIPQTRFAAALMRAYNRRLVSLARTRRRLGVYGRRNLGWRDYRVAFGLGRKSLPALTHGIRLYLGAEVETLLARLRLLPGRKVSSPRPLPAP